MMDGMGCGFCDVRSGWAIVMVDVRVAMEDNQVLWLIWRTYGEET